MAFGGVLSTAFCIFIHVTSEVVVGAVGDSVNNHAE